MKIQLVSFFLGRVYFSMKLLEFMSEGINRVTTDLEKQEKSGNLLQNYKSQEKVREFRCLKFVFSQVEDPNFEIFWRSMPPDPLNGLGLRVEFNLGLEKSGKSQGISHCLESGNPE